jgi:hypothetical protein
MRLVRIILVAALGACAHKPPPPPAPPPPTQIVVDGARLTPDANEQVRRVIPEHHAERAGLIVIVRGAAADDGFDLGLEVIRTDSSGIERHHHITQADCESAGQLVALEVDRFLTSFPEWADPPRPLPVSSQWTEIAPTAAVSSMWRPVGVEAQAGALVDHGGWADRFGGSVVVRASVPQHAGAGRFQQTAFLAGALWRHRFYHWDTRAELRAGGLLVSGIGFAQNDHSWLLWSEAAGFVGRRLSWGTLGVELAATALRDHAVTRDGLVSEDIPLLRVGLSGTFGSPAQ